MAGRAEARIALTCPYFEFAVEFGPSKSANNPLFYLTHMGRKICPSLFFNSAKKRVLNILRWAFSLFFWNVTNDF
jgi:hypothetical protein